MKLSNKKGRAWWVAAYPERERLGWSDHVHMLRLKRICATRQELDATMDIDKACGGHAMGWVTAWFGLIWFVWLAYFGFRTRDAELTLLCTPSVSKYKMF
jgi:hypothetical protein